MKYYKKITGDRSLNGYVIYAGSQEQNLHDIQVLNYKNVNSIWQQLKEKDSE